MQNNIFQIIEGFIKVGILTLIVIGIIIYVFIKKGGQQYIAEWTLHRDKPSVIPIAGLFGKDTQQNLQGGIYAKFKTNFSFLIQPIQYIINLITKILGNLINSMNIFRTILKPIREFFTNAATSFYDKINSFSIMIVYSFSKMRNLLRRLSSSFRLVLYTLQSIQLTIRSVWNGPIGNVSRNWAYANDNIRDFFCFHQDTPIMLANNSYIAIRDLKIGMQIANSNNNKSLHSTIIGMVISLTNKTELYKVNNVVMTKSHLVRSNGKWKRAEEIGSYIATSNNELIYCPISDNVSHELVVGYDNLITKDYNEIDNYKLDNYLLNYSLSKLNNINITTKFKFTTDELSGEVGISAESYLNRNDGTYIKAKDIEIGTLLDTGKVLSIMVFKLLNPHTYQLTPKLQITCRQVLYDNYSWKLPTSSFTKKMDETNSLYYSFYTTSGIYKSDNIILADMFDAQTPDNITILNKITEKYLNNIS